MKGRALWGWLKKKLLPSDELTAFAEELIKPQALAVALAETVCDYEVAIRAGKLTFPAHRRAGASVIDIWADLRIEALSKLFNFGRAEPYLLSDLRRQEELLNCFLDDRVHLEFPQPRGEIVPDTIQGMFQVYLYLDATGSEVADRETDHSGLKLDGRSIIDRIEATCADVRPKWLAFRANPGLNSVPLTMIELLYADVTAKAKSIALSTKFGPNYESGIKFVENLLLEQGDNPVAFRAMVERIMRTDDPDHWSA